MSTNRWDETWHRLREWTNGQAPSERLAVQTLYSEGFTELDPSHPLGGPDGKRDAIALKNGKRWVMAVYFPRGEQEFKLIKDKFLNDLEGVKSNDMDGIAFVTNQELRLSERESLVKLAEPYETELFHLERLTAILDKPEMAEVRKQFLGIEDETITTLYGGEGGKAPGAGGGGGAALGKGSRGGDGGHGGDFRFEGQPGQAPGAGGGGAAGEEVGGEGGGGGEIVAALFRAEDLPETIEIIVGEGGIADPYGGDGRDGGDTIFGDLLRAKGGKGGRAATSDPPARSITDDDIKNGFQICGIYLAENIYVRDGLLNLLYAGWGYFTVPRLPFGIDWPLLVTVSLGNLASGTYIELLAVLTDPTDREAERYRFTVFKGEGEVVSLRHSIIKITSVIQVAGVWTVSIYSGNNKLITLPIEIRCSSTQSA